MFLRSARGDTLSLGLTAREIWKITVRSTVDGGVSHLEIYAKFISKAHLVKTMHRGLSLLFKFDFEKNAEFYADFQSG